MLKRIKIENLRGIREGEIDGLTRLVVLVGANGSGKSTVLEGALIGGVRHPAEAVGTVARRRVHTWNGAAWVIHGANDATVALAEVEWADEACITRRIRWDSKLVLPPQGRERLVQENAPGPWTALRIYRDRPPMPEIADGVQPFSVAAMAGNNGFVPFEVEDDLQPPPVRLVDPTTGQSLHDLFTQAVRAGRREDLMKIAQTVVSDLDSIEILTEEGTPRLCFTFRTGPVFVVPVSLAGDGIHALLRMVFELASPIGGTILLEEPEVHMHPRALSSCAEAIVAAVRRDVQVVMTTHSLELIDRLLSALTDDEVEDPSMMTLLRARLRDGILTTVSIPANEAEAARTELAEDLR